MRIDAGVAEKREREPHLAEGTQHGMLHVHGHRAGLRLRAREGGGDVVDRAAGDLGGVEDGQPVGGGPLGEAGGEDRAEVGAVVDAVAVGREARVRGQARQPERVAQARPLALAADRDRELAVGRGEGLVRDEVRVGVAQAPGRRARWRTRSGPG